MFYKPKYNQILHFNKNIHMIKLKICRQYTDQRTTD